MEKERKPYIDPIELWGKHGDWDIRWRDPRDTAKAFPIANDDRIPSWGKDDPWWPIFKRCESPIEKDICELLHNYGTFTALQGDWSFDGIQRSAGMDGEICGIFGQVEMLRYRVDFLAVRYSRRQNHFRRCVIECDGHEFHQATQEQRDRDAIRDNQIRDKYPGIGVMRLAGTTIKRRPLVCLDAILIALG